MNMKKYSFVIVATLWMAIIITGCSKKFLDEPKPTQSLDPSVVYSSDAGVRSLLTGIYRRLRQQYGTSTDAWGIASVYLAREVKGLDVTLPDQNWYSFDYQHDNREPTYRRVSFTWNFFYDMVNQANNLIAGVDASKTLSSEANKKAFIGEGKALRAWCYFELVREYAHAYAENPAGPGIPLYSTPTGLETTGNPRASIADVYKLITDDLEYAAANLGTARQLKDVINKSVATGLLARVYLEMGQWEKAKTAAITARTGYALSAADYNTPFTSLDKAEVMWGFPQAADQTIYYGTPSAFWGSGSTVPGYYNFFIDSLFANSFAETDIRKNTLIRTSNITVKKWRSSKFGLSTTFTDAIITMRAAEMYLIEAEAKAELADATAGDILYIVQKNRNVSAVKSGATGATLVTEILLERRKELYGELGVSFMDIKRRQLPLVRDAGHPLNFRVNLPANSNKFTLKIPQTEMDANKSLKPTDQNQ